MSEVVETVARAMSIEDKGVDHWDVMSEDGDGYGYVGKNEYRAMARAGIAALRAATVIDLCASILGNDETIERVARTMCRSSYDGREVWDVIGPMKQNAFRRDVRQVMAAMLEVLTA